MNKKGLSDIVTTTLIIVLVVAAVVIMWRFLQPVLQFPTIEPLTTAPFICNNLNKSMSPYYGLNEEISNMTTIYEADSVIISGGSPVLYVAKDNISDSFQVVCKLKYKICRYEQNGTFYVCYENIENQGIIINTTDWKQWYENK